MNETFCIQIKAKIFFLSVFSYKGEESMMRMKEGHTEMETISPTGTGNEVIKFVFKQWHQAQFFSNTPFGDLKTLSGGQEKKIFHKTLWNINDVLNL